MLGNRVLMYEGQYGFSRVAQLPFIRDTIDFASLLVPDHLHSRRLRGGCATVTGSFSAEPGNHFPIRKRLNQSD